MSGNMKGIMTHLERCLLPPAMNSRNPRQHPLQAVAFQQELETRLSQLTFPLLSPEALEVAKAAVWPKSFQQMCQKHEIGVRQLESDVSFTEQHLLANELP